MRRLARHLFTLCSAVSLLLCVAVCVLWVRSYYWWDYASATWGNRSSTTVSLNSLNGAVAVEFGVLRLVPMRPGFEAYWDSADTDDDDEMSFAAPRDFGVRWHRQDAYPPYEGLYVEVPHLVAILLFASPAVLLVRRWHRRRLRRLRGLCPSCGYDLRASPGRCPECGSPTEITSV